MAARCSSAHYSFCGLDPRGLKDRYADYWELNSTPRARSTTRTASPIPATSRATAPTAGGLLRVTIRTVIPRTRLTMTTARSPRPRPLRVFPYAPQEVMRALRHFLASMVEQVWGRYGFVDAFCEQRNWYADTFLAIDQGPIIVMMENHRTGLLWKLFMSVPEVQTGLRRLGFTSPWLGARSVRMKRGSSSNGSSGNTGTRPRPCWSSRLARWNRQGAAGLRPDRAPRQRLDRRLPGARRLGPGPGLLLPLVPGFGGGHRCAAPVVSRPASRRGGASTHFGDFVRFSLSLLQRSMAAS